MTLSKTPSFAPLPDEIAVPVSGDLTRRQYDEQSHPYRSSFARDVARVFHARAFRRLAGKTQVFTRLPADVPSDHIRSRLTHTLEVTQISRVIAGALGLNAELTEALALVHDIGHPPFGHAGEKALDHCLQAHGLRFDHNLHALRIVTWFEERYAAFRGLNLTLGVREGIIKHSRDYLAATHPQLSEYFLEEFPPLEAQLVDLADEIAYLTADLDDGLDSEILSLEQVRESVPLFRVFHDSVLREYPDATAKLSAYETLKRVLNALVTDLIEETRSRVLAIGAKTLTDIRHAPQRLVSFSANTEADRKQAKGFLYRNFYSAPELEIEHAHAEEVIRGLFAVFIHDPSLLPPDHQSQVPSEGLARTVADYIAGMTDAYIEQLWLQHR